MQLFLRRRQTFAELAESIGVNSTKLQLVALKYSAQALFHIIQSALFKIFTYVFKKENYTFPYRGKKEI